MGRKIRVGISKCLLGEKVRYDGGHKHDRSIVERLGPYVEWVPVCPEVECGFGVPRETVDLVGDVNAPRFVTSQTKVDHTDRITAWAQERVAQLEKEKLAGFVLKARSPSCGLGSTAVRLPNGRSRRVGTGIFARVLQEHFPTLPVVEEGDLQRGRDCKAFLKRVGVTLAD